MASFCGFSRRFKEFDASVGPEDAPKSRVSLESNQRNFLSEILLMFFLSGTLQRMDRARLNRWAPRLALLGVVLAHVAMVLYYEPPALILGPRPVGGFDWETHYGQVADAVEAVHEHGQVWAYDPQRLAGQPTGVIFDADNKAWELWAVALTALGVPLHTAFNLFLWLAALFVPLVLWSAARLFSLERGTAVVAAALGSACYLFDSNSHWVSWVGMICWGASAYLSVLALALFWRWLERRSHWLLFALLLLLVGLHTLHPYVFFVLVMPMTALYWRYRRSLGWRQHGLVIAVAAVTVAANLWWILPSVHFWHYILDSGFYLDAKLDFLLSDYLGLLQEPSVSGVMAVRSSFRFLALGGAAIGLWLWRKERDPRFMPLGLGIATMLLITYLGGYSAVTKMVQPYRFSLPAMYLAIVPAAAFLCRGVKAFRDSKPSGAVAGLLLLLLFVTVPRMVRDVIYFVPQLVPETERPLPAPPPDINGSIAFGNVRWPRHFDFRHRPDIGLDLALAAEYVRATDDGSGRWLVEWWMLGERLAWSTKAQVIGGFLEINLAHSDANLFRRHHDPQSLSDEELRAYFQQYAIKWVIISNPMPGLEARRQLLRPRKLVAGHRIYDVVEPTGFIVGDGDGEVASETNRITVRGSAGGSLVLRYHWLETLRCRPDCQLRRVDASGDRVGFIGVEGATADFEIFNAY